MTVTKTLIDVRIFVDDITAVLVDYDQIEVYRSDGDASGPWTPVAAYPGPTPATILADEHQEPFQLSGLSLLLELNGTTQVPVTFPGADPYTGAAALTDINTALGALGLATLPNGSVRVTTTATGTGASVQVMGGTGYANLGFQLDDSGLGSSGPITLVAGQHDYVFQDQNGDRSYWYRTRYRKSTTSVVSPYSVPFPADAVQKLPTSSLITGTCHLVDLSGNALKKQRLHIYNVFEPSTSGGYGVFGMDKFIETDEDGFASIVLVRGALVEVLWVGTSVRRRLRVPTDPLLQTFDLLDPTLSPDEFGIQVPNILVYARTFP